MTGQGTIDFAGLDGRIWLDGQLVAWKEARLHALTHALHYGSAVFEGQRAYGGNIFKLTQHTRRLHRSANMLGFEIPWCVAQINQACEEVLRANHLADAYLRPIAWRGSETMSVSAEPTRVHLAVAAWAWTSYFPPATVSMGLRLDLARWRRPPPATAPTAAKASGLYIICTMAAEAAHARGYDDALMLDWRGRVAEATGANIFFVRDGALYTPPPDCFLDGITRRTIIDLARRRGIDVIERPIWPRDLDRFEQCFLTGSAAEVMPVRAAGPWSFEVGALTLQLREDYLNLVNGRLAGLERDAA